MKIIKSALSHGFGRRDLAFLAFVSLSLAVILVAFQQAPGLSASTFVALSESGYAQCIASGWVEGEAGCGDTIGFPSGGVRVFGLPINTVAATTGLDGVVSLSDALLISGIFTVVAFAGAVCFFGGLFSSRSLGLLGAILYLLAPVVSGQGDYSTLRLGFALLPSYLLVDLLLLKLPVQRWPERVAIVTLVALVRCFAVLCDGYSFVMSSGIAFGVFCVYLLSANSRRAALYAMSAYGFACAVAYATYSLAVPGGETALGPMPADFFRGQGVDVFSMLVPSSRPWVYESIGWFLQVEPAAAYGDGSNLAFNFLGYTALASGVAVTMILLLRRIVVPYIVVGVLLCGLGAVALSFGPSLKYKSWDLAKSGQPVTFDSYLMPAEKAVRNLGTEWIYQSVPGVRNVRVLARWLTVLHFGLVLCVLFLISVSMTRGRIGLAVVISALALIEAAPNLPRLLDEGRARYREAAAISEDYVRDLASLTRPGEITLLAPLHVGAERNHFLADFLCPHALLRCYNIGGDKASQIASDHWPVEVQLVMQQRLVDESLTSLFSRGDLEVAIVPLFDLRRLAYSRAAGSIAEGPVRQFVQALADTGRYKIYEGNYFIALRPSDSLRENPLCGLPCWQDWETRSPDGIVDAWGPTQMQEGAGFNRQVNGRSAFWVKIPHEAEKFVLALGGVLLPTLASGTVGSAQISKEAEDQLIAGKEYEVRLINAEARYSVSLGNFRVTTIEDGP